MSENTRVGIGALKDRRIVQADRRLAAMFGYEAQEFIGLDACSMCSLHTSGDAAGQAQGAHGLPDSDKCGSFADEVQFRRKDGTLFWGHCGFTGVDRSHASNDVVWMVEDITERKRSERVWSAGEARLQRALDASRLALWDYDLASGEVYLSEIWSELMGGPQVPTKTTFEALAALVPAEDQLAIAAAMVPVIKGERQSYQIEHRVRKPGGEFIWILSEGRVVERGADGRALRAVGTNRDITERKRMDQELRRAAILWDSLPIAIGHADRAERITFVNRMYRTLFSGAPDYVGRTVREIVGDQLYLPVAPNIQRALAGEESRIIRPARRDDGSIGARSIRYVPERDAAGRVVGFFALIEDVTERKRGEAQQRLAASVFDNAAEGIVITDKDNNILSVNRAFTEITGYSPEEAIGRNPRMLKSGLQSGAFYEAMWASIRETGRWQGEVWNGRKDGRRYCELLSIAAIRSDQGETTQYCAIFSDITKLKTTEAELMALNAQLEARVAQRTAALDRANKELETFSYSVSHDLRAPLRHISGFSAIVLKANEGRLDAASVDHLKRINAASERMGLLIADLLALSRVSRQELSKRDFDLSKLAGQVVDSLIRAHPEREVRVMVKPDMKAHGDAGLVRIVLENLIGNAWKYTGRANESRIEVGLEERDGETVHYVRDNGAGFDMKYAHKLFEPFQRLHTDNEFKGTGIGLSIVQRIVARHDGRIWAEAKVGEGAAFYFTLGRNHR